MYWILSIHTMLHMCFKYHVFLCIQVWRKIVFSFRSLVFEKIRVFGLKLNFYTSKIVQTFCNMCWFLITHICTSNIDKNLFLWNFMYFIWFFRVFTSPFFNPENHGLSLLAVDRPVDRTRARSPVSQLMCTDTCT